MMMTTIPNGFLIMVNPSLQLSVVADACAVRIWSISLQRGVQRSFYEGFVRTQGSPQVDAPCTSCTRR